jgi:hypothetical protein
MDAGTIFVIVATILFVGFIVWVNACGPREADAQTPAKLDSSPQSVRTSESTMKGKTMKKKR